MILSIASKEIEGYKGTGTGFIVKGSTGFITAGKDFDRIKQKSALMRTIQEITMTSAKQMLCS